MQQNRCILKASAMLQSFIAVKGLWESFRGFLPSPRILENINLRLMRVRNELFFDISKQKVKTYLSIAYLNKKVPTVNYKLMFVFNNFHEK